MDSVLQPAAHAVPMAITLILDGTVAQITRATPRPTEQHAVQVPGITPVQDTTAAQTTVLVRMERPAPAVFQ
jgi:hypothetical protein